VRTRTECTDIIRGDKQWTVNLHAKSNNKKSSVTARAIVNASGPWVEKTLDLDEEHDSKHGVRLVKGSHVVVPKLFDHEYTYIFQNADNRVIFAVPYEQNFTLLGTTDVEVGDEPGKQSIDKDEVAYICDNASEYFKTPIDPKTVVWSYSGVRPLYDDASENASKVTRDYKLDLDVRKGSPILSVYGGKITTYRKLAEQAVEMLLAPLQHQGKSWTATAPLPGGDISHADFDQFLKTLTAQYPWMDDNLLYDYARNYGTRVRVLLDKVSSADGLGTHFGGPLYQAEVDYLIKYEWAQTAEDVLWRRSKKGLHVPEGTSEKLQDYLDATRATD